ncbi:leucine-rich repeats and immunoglobulin-like domains protein 1 [Xyrichtys novacula]|nr:leucine-rich repeats and immunoglobulin-like domains protein 1 [Xyrichtys novacula]
MAGTEVIQIKVIRVRWCRNHPVCQGSTPSVFDSKPPKDSIPENRNKPRYTYLGDIETNCTLQIRGFSKTDEATLRFRMEVNHTEGHFTNQSGVNVTVAEETPMKIQSSRNHEELEEGGRVTLDCTTKCTFNQINVTWFRDNLPLQESGHSLQLGPLTAEDSGNYTCALVTNKNTLSPPYALNVKEREGQNKMLLIVSVASGVLLVLLTLIVVLWIFKRKRSSDRNQSAVGGQVQRKDPETIYSNVLLTSNPQRRSRVQGPSRAVEDVSYTSVQFQHKKQDRGVAPMEDPVIYSSVTSRG